MAVQLRAFTLFATHYFELTALAGQVDGCANVHLDATEHADSLVFLHAVRDGPANRSFGLQVAQLAGVPREVILAARGYLAQLEAGSLTQLRAAAGPQAELPLFTSAPAPARTPAPAPAGEAAAAPLPPQDELHRRLAAIEPDELTPRRALELLYELRQLARTLATGAPGPS
jgi:DNA mismatch repair protein MutS